MVMHKIFFSDLVRVALLAIAATHLPTLTAQGSGGSSPMPIGEFPAPPAQKPNAGKELERMSKRYDLSAEQKSRIGPILVEHQSKIVGLLHDPSLAADDKASRFGEIDSEMVSKIAAILSPAQRANSRKTKRGNVTEISSQVRQRAHRRLETEADLRLNPKKPSC